jgi:hypothetical protein
MLRRSKWPMKAVTLLLLFALAAAGGPSDKGSSGAGWASIENLRVGSRSKSTPGMPGYVYFADERLGDVMRVRPDGTAMVNQTGGDNPAGADRFPSPSFDGRQVVYAWYDSSGG